MSETKRMRCSREGWCWALDAAVLHDFTERAPGLSELRLFKMNSADEDRDGRSAGIVYRPGRRCEDATFRRKGRLLNFCPWCGEDIDFTDAKPKAAAESGE